jgi:hypothetical protein
MLTGYEPVRSPADSVTTGETAWLRLRSSRLCGSTKPHCNAKTQRGRAATEQEEQTEKLKTEK